jgi:hypothetical protein
MSTKRLSLVAALAALALASTGLRASAQGVPVTQPKFVPGGNSTFRGPFPGFNLQPPGGAVATQSRTPTVFPGVASANGIVTPASYLGNNLGQTMDQTYQLIVQTNALQTVTQNQGQFGQFGNLGSSGMLGQLGQLGQLGSTGQLGTSGALGALGGQLGLLGGVGGKVGSGGAVGLLGAFGSRYYGF